MQKLGECNVTNGAVTAWVEEMAKLCQPDRIWWCDGSEEEKEAILQDGIRTGVFIKLNQKKLPGCYYHRSNPNDVARVEQCTYICTETEEEAGRLRAYRFDLRGSQHAHDDPHGTNRPR